MGETSAESKEVTRDRFDDWIVAGDAFGERSTHASRFPASTSRVR